MFIALFKNVIMALYKIQKQYISYTVGDLETTRYRPLHCQYSLNVYSSSYVLICDKAIKPQARTAILNAKDC